MRKTLALLALFYSAFTQDKTHLTSQPPTFNPQPQTLQNHNTPTKTPISPNQPPRSTNTPNKQQNSQQQSQINIIIAQLNNDSIAQIKNNKISNSVEYLSRVDLEKIVNNADTAAILSVLKGLNDDMQMDCRDKVMFLLDFVSLLRSAANRKQAAANQLTTIVGVAKFEISRLTDDIEAVKKEKSALRITEYQAKIADIINKLKVYYEEIKSTKAPLPAYEKQILELQQNIEDLSKQNDEIRSKMMEDRLKIVQADNLITDLQQRLKQAKSKKQSLQQQISESKQTIKSNNQQILNFLTTIEDIRQKIENLNNTVYNIKKQINALQVQLERARSDLSEVQIKDKRLINMIQNYQQRIKKQQERLVQDMLRDIRVLIQKIAGVFGMIEREINRVYYLCYGGEFVEFGGGGEGIGYVIQGEAFRTYVSRVYGHPLSVPQTLNGKQIKIQAFIPFTQKWQQKYGNKQSNLTVQASKCLGNGRIFSGNGIITKINNSNEFEIRDILQRKLVLKISNCSRVEMEFNQMEFEIGQTVWWRGTQFDFGVYVIKAATAMKL